MPSSPAPAPSPIVTPIAPLPPGTAALFGGAPPARIVLASQPLDVDPQGFARWLVRARFVDALGRPTELLRGGNIDFVPSHGSAQWQTRLRFGGPAAIVSTTQDGPLRVRVRAAVGVPLAEVSAVTDTRRWAVARIVARPLGPHAVWIGWFPRAASGTVEVERVPGPVPAQIARVAAPASSTVDTTVLPERRYRYDIRLPDGRRALLTVEVPAEPLGLDRSAIAGKKMWLSFSPSLLDLDRYDRLDPAAIVAQAQSAGLHAIVLRTAYGPFDEIAPAAKPTIDRLIDLAAAHGIATIAWTVPRSTSFEDLAAAVASSVYRTQKGSGVGALAVDLERGEYFLGDGPAGYTALATYLGALRAAVGPNVPIVATVEDPYLEHLTRVAYPYDAIAADADVLQPMAYWRMLSRAPFGPGAVRAAVRGSYAATLREAGRPIAIDMGLQSAGDGPHGAPLPAEIAASIEQSRKVGAVGVTFFDWNGTSNENWKVLEATPW